MVSKLSLTASLAAARYRAADSFNDWINKGEAKFKAAHEEALLEINSIKAQIKHLFGGKE